MLYAICILLGVAAGFVLCGFFAAGARADCVTDASVAIMRAESLERANGVLRRELAELRLTHEAPRDHGYARG